MRFALSWWISRGHAGDLDLTDRQVVMVGGDNDDEPGTPWTAGLFIDDVADVGQQAVLVDIFLGRAGGTPNRNYTAARSTHRDRRRTRCHQPGHQRRHRRIRVNGRVEVAAETDSEETVACGMPVDQPGQEVCTTTLQAQIEALVWEWSDPCGFATKFAYRSDR